MNFRQGPRAPLSCLALLAVLCCCGVHRPALGQSAGGAPVAEKQPLRVVVIGDSIMWGQGLDDRYKFRYMVQRWLEERTGRQVEEHLYAHAGAIVEAPENPESDPEYRLKSIWVPHEEVNFGYPTITEQACSAARRLGQHRKDVDLVLMDGCINDFDFRNLLNVNNTVGAVEKQTEKKCGTPMGRLLTLVREEFPNALVVVTGYYPLIYKGDSDSGQVKRTYNTTGGPVSGKGKEIGGTANNVLTRAAISRLSKGSEKNGADKESAEGAPCAGKPSECLHPLSEQWYKSSNRVLNEQVNDANEGLPEKRVVFAELSYPPEFAFSTAQSMLWNIRFGSTNMEGLKKAAVVLLDGIDTFKPNDASREARARGCENAYRDMKNIHRAMQTRLKKLLRDPKVDEKEKERQREQEKSVREYMDGFKLACKYGSLGHPNKFGSALYAQSIIAHLTPFLPRLREPRASASSAGDAGRVVESRCPPLATRATGPAN